jgi:hypothetical protein
LSKNGEISQERKTLVPWSCFLSVNGESLPFVIWMCILPILENLLEISSKIHSLRNQYAYCHAADPDCQMQTFHQQDMILDVAKQNLQAPKKQAEM